jgi:uncharacterized membrane protein
MTSITKWWAFSIIGLLAIIALPAMLTKWSWGPIYFDSKSADIASTIGGIAGTIMSGITLLVLVITTLQANQEKAFQQTLMLTNQTINLYADALRKYQTEGKERQYFSMDKENFGPGKGIILPYLRMVPLSLFKVVESHLGQKSLSTLQYKAVASIIVLQLEPIIQEFLEEMDNYAVKHGERYTKIEEDLRVQLATTNALRHVVEAE